MNTTDETTDTPVAVVASNSQQPGDVVVTPDSVDRLPIQTAMFLRLTYWLNSSLTKSVNAGLQAYFSEKPYQFEPCVMLANTDRKVFRLTHDEWNSLVSSMNNVSLCVVKKGKDTTYLPNDDLLSSIAITVRSIFGKVHLTLFKFDVETTPFSLSTKEWYELVNNAPNISEHLNQLESDKVSVNERIHDQITSSSVHVGNLQVFKRLAEEVNAFIRSSSSV